MINSATENSRHQDQKQLSYGNIVIIGDHQENVDILAHGLTQAGLKTTAADVKDITRKYLTDGRFDIILVDLFHAVSSAVSLAWQLSTMFDGPVIVIGYENDERYHVDLYNAGIAEYIRKPISVSLLIARVTPWIRRALSRKSPDQSIRDEFRIDPIRRTVMTPDGRSMRLSKLEYQLFDILYRNKGRILTPTLLVDRIWGEFEEGDNRLKHLVRRLRKKIEPDPHNSIYIITVGTDGYCLRPTSRSQVLQRTSPPTVASKNTPRGPFLRPQATQLRPKPQLGADRMSPSRQRLMNE